MAVDVSSNGWPVKDSPLSQFMPKTSGVIAELRSQCRTAETPTLMLSCRDSLLCCRYFSQAVVYCRTADTSTPPLTQSAIAEKRGRGHARGELHKRGVPDASAGQAIECETSRAAVAAALKRVSADLQKRNRRGNLTAQPFRDLCLQAACIGVLPKIHKQGLEGTTLS